MKTERKRTKRSISALKWMRERRLEHKRKFKIPEQKEPGPIPCPMYPGYYYIPWTESLLVINKIGEIISLVKGKKLKGLSVNGYRNIWLLINNVYKSSKIHRIVAQLFVEKPERHKDKSFDELQVNHKDGNKINNDYRNLEWVTNAENAKHAWDIGLSTATGSVPVIVKNEKNEETRFDSVLACSRAIGIDILILHRHLKSSLVGRVTANGYYFKYDDGTPWPIEPRPDLILHREGYFISGLARNVETNKTIAFCYLKDICAYLGLSIKGLNWSRVTYGNDRPYYGWVFTNRCDNLLLKKKLTA